VNRRLYGFWRWRYTMTKLEVVIGQVKNKFTCDLR
jgi:hypothetical protein